MKKIYIVLILVGKVCFCTSTFLDIAQLGFEQYQDIIINGEIIKPATGRGKDCATRYTFVKNILNRYHRPFTMIDLGAAQGYYSFKAAIDFPHSVFVMMEGNNEAYPLTGDQLFDLCKLNNLNNTILLQTPLVPSNLFQLGFCEHFDIVLAFNIIHWFPDQWQKMTDAILNLGETIIIETPPKEQNQSKSNNDIREAIENYIQNNGAIPLGKVKRHTSDAYSTIYLIQRKKSYLIHRNLIYTNSGINTHIIQSDENEKRLIKINQSTHQKTFSVWQPGINLITFKMTNGSYPLFQDIKNALKSIIDIRHPDWMPNNMIIQGKKLVLIDRERTDMIFPYSPQKELDIIQWLSLTDPEEVHSVFKTLLY